MCLEIPVQVVEVDPDRTVAEVTADGRHERILLVALDGESGPVGPGDWLLAHCGIAVRRIDRDEAHERTELLDAVRRAGADDG